MKYLIKKSQTVITQENDISRFHEYRFPFKNASLGISEINGRYPENGFDIDKEIEQSWYVESGSGIIWINNEELQIEQGDMIFISENEKYWIQGEKLRLVVCSSPPWFPKQHNHVD